MPRKARKSIPVPVELPAIVKAWVDAQAEELGLDAATWIRMKLVLMSKGAQLPETELPDWRQVERAPPSVEESALDAIVGEKLADAEAGGLGTTAMGEGGLDTNQVRALRRPPTPYSPTTQPKHLQAL